MKALAVLPYFFILFGISSCASHKNNDFSEPINVDIFVNGDKTATSLSKSKENFLTVEGTGCDKFTLTGQGVSLKVVDGGYIATPSNIEFATISIMGYIGKKVANVGTRRYTIVE